MLHPLQLFKTLSDETRLSIVMLLREAGLAIDRREGKWIYYRLSPNMPAWAATVIDNSWNCLREETRMKLKNRLPGSC